MFYMTLAVEQKNNKIKKNFIKNYKKFIALMLLKSYINMDIIIYQHD